MPSGSICVQKNESFSREKYQKKGGSQKKKKSKMGSSTQPREGKNSSKYLTIPGTAEGGKSQQKKGQRDQNMIRRKRKELLRLLIDGEKD